MAPLSQPGDDEPVADLIGRTKTSRERAHFRPTADQKELFVRAAGLNGQTLSDFMRSAVEEKARQVIADHERIVLTASARATFLAALADPPHPNDRLVALAHRYAREVESRP